MRSLIAGLLVMVAGQVLAVNFNASDGTGSATTAEIDALFGPGQIRNTSFTAIRQDYYNCQVQYISGGQAVTRPFTVAMRTHATVRTSPTAGGVDFVGYGIPTRMSPVPAAGGGHVFYENGQPVTGRIVSATYSNYDTTVVASHGVVGTSQVYP